MITYCDFNFSQEHTLVNFEWEYKISFQKNAFENDMCKIAAISSMFEWESLNWNGRNAVILTKFSSLAAPKDVIFIWFSH